mgnify:FL=1
MVQIVAPGRRSGGLLYDSASCDIIKEMYFVENKQRKRNILYYSVNYANISLVCIYFHKTKLRMEAYL